MKKGLTELVFILDKSGSMCGLEADTIGGFNAMLKEQKGKDGEVLVSTVLFSDDSVVLHDRVSIDEVKELTEKDYRVGGCTALLDAIGGAIHHIGNVHKYAREDDRPEHTLFVITTDGLENASRRYGADRVKEMIRKEEEKYGWEFIFVAANIDAVATAERIGIRREQSVDYVCDEEGTRVMHAGINRAVCNMRAYGSVSKGECWDAEIRKDYNTRKKRSR